MRPRFMAAAFTTAWAVAAPAAAQSYDFATLGFRFEAGSQYDVVQEGIKVTVSDEATGDRIEIVPFAITDRDASRRQRVGRWFELMDYEFDGADEVRGDGFVIVTGEGGDTMDFVRVRDVYVDSDGGLRIIVFADPLELDQAFAVADAIEITDPAAIMNAARIAGMID